MFRKTLKISIPIILISIIVLIAHNAYKNTQQLTESPITVIPTNASIILQLNDVKNLSKYLQSSKIWVNLQNIEQIKKISENSQQLSDFFTRNQSVLNSNQMFISVHKVSANKSAYLYSLSFKRENIKDNKEIIALFDNDIETFKYDNQTIYFSNTLDKYFSFKNDILFYSNNKLLLTDAVRISNKNTEDLFTNPLFSTCYNTISKSADINLIFNYNNLLYLTNSYKKFPAKISNFSEWTAADIKLKDNTILASGLSSLNKTIKNFTDIFNQQKSQKLNILEIIPSNTTHLFAVSFNRPKDIYEKKNEILRIKHEFRSWNLNRKWIEDSTNIDYNDFINEIDNEAGLFNTSSTLNSDNSYTYLKTKESIRVNSLLQEMITESLDYKDYRINKIIDNNLTSNLFGDFFKINNSFFTTINDYLIFGKSIASLEYVIDNYTSKKTYSNNKSVKNFSSYISNNANIFIYLNLGKTAESLKNSLVNKKLLKFESDSIAKFTALSLQINASKNGMLHNLCLFYDEEYKESIKEEWYYPLDTNTAINPQFVNNHFTNTEMILVQDKHKNLIALNTLGEKVWSKKISEEILGKISYIDFYKNNKFQALFNTNNQLYLLDRNGEFVDGFPIELPETTSIQHSLIDYDKNKKYRIMITGNDNVIYNLDKKGRNITGWKYKKTKNQINQNPIHFIVNNKDYILNATTNSSTKLLARNGTDRVKFNEIETFITPVKISESGKLYSITDENKIWIGNVNGLSETIDVKKPNITNIIMLEDGYYIANENSLSYVNDTIEQKININLDSSIQDISSLKGYITITTKKHLYLIKNNKIIEGFPIESDGYFNLSDFDNNGKINVLNIKNDIIYNYELEN